jgi:hypothetical protein
MDIYTLNKATGIQDEIKSLKEEKDIWESATSFCAAPRCTNYNGYWWDIDDETSRIEVLSILIDIYERKLNDENLYYIE